MTRPKLFWAACQSPPISLVRTAFVLALLFLTWGSAGVTSAAKPVVSRTFNADAQLNLKSSYEVGEPIRVGCTCKPGEGVSLATEWSYGEGVRALDVDDLTKDVYAVPGLRTLSVKLKLLKTHKLTVLVPGPNWPTDPKDLKQQVIEVFDGYTESTLEGVFFQKGTVEPPVPPGPNPPPNPPPPPQPTVGPLRVIILEETADRSKYSKDVTGSYLSAAVADYLRKHTAEHWDWGIWDDDFTDETLKGGGFGNLVDLYGRAKADSGANTAASKEPWVVIEQKDGTGKPVLVHTGPVTVDLLNTLKRFGGP